MSKRKETQIKNLSTRSKNLITKTPKQKKIYVKL